MFLPKLLEVPPLGGFSRRRSLNSDFESSLGLSFRRPRHCATTRRHQVRQLCPSPPRNRSTAIAESTPFPHSIVHMSEFGAFDLTPSFCLFPLVSCSVRDSGREPLAPLLLEQMSHFACPVLRIWYMILCPPIFLVGKASLGQLTERRRPNPNQNSAVVDDGDGDVERDIHPTRERHDARGSGPLPNPLARPHTVFEYCRRKGQK